MSKVEQIEKWIEDIESEMEDKGTSLTLKWRKKMLEERLLLEKEVNDKED
jgi:hypothetical protein